MKSKSNVAKPCFAINFMIRFRDFLNIFMDFLLDFSEGIQDFKVVGDPSAP